MDDLIRRSDVIGLLEDMLLFGEYDIIASSFSEADEEKAYRAINDIPAVNRWISVEDEYPEPCKSVLIAFSDSSGVRLQCVGIRSATHPNVWLDMHGGRINNVTHWQSLPEPPEKE